MKNFEESFETCPTTGCWLWLESCTTNGYGRLSSGGRRVSAHRYSWIYYKGEIPTGLWVLHHCDVRSCVNPNHLFLGTRSDNTIDCAYKSRLNTSKLTLDKVFKIRNDERSQRKIAKDYGVSQAQISNIKRRAQWVHC